MQKKGFGVWIFRLLYDFQFCTRIPINRALPIDAEDAARATGLFPLVGLVVGLVAAAGHWIGWRTGSPLVAGALAALFELAVTGGLHLDGLGDVCDGVFSGRSRERMLEIMKDSHSGSFGVAGITMTLILKTVLFSALPLEAVLISPMLGRAALTVCAATGEYARKEGLGKSFINGVGLRDAALAMAMALPAMLIHPSVMTLIAWFAVPWVGFLMAKYFEKKLGGITGDCLGATQEVSQMVALFVLLL